MSKVRKLFPATEQSGEFCNYLECEFDGQSKAIISISSSPIDGAPVNFYLDLETAIELNKQLYNVINLINPNLKRENAFKRASKKANNF